MTPKHLFILFICCFFATVSFGQEHHNHADPYDWDNPAQSFSLDEKLVEISGLSVEPTETYLLAVQDELGELFVLDKMTGRIVQQIPFWKEGDYEGIEQVGSTVYVVKSTGTIYEVANAGTSEQTVEKYNGFLTGDNDIEGLSYWPERNQLLLACKAQPGGELDPNRFKAIYAFDLETKSFLTEPLLLLDRGAVSAYLKDCKPGPDHHKLCDIFDPEKADFDLSPAALAVHPLTGNFYLTSSKGNLLIVINSIGEILHIDKLPKALHRQPEGLCFDLAGNLYISNEQKKDTPPLIHYYLYDPNRTTER